MTLIEQSSWWFLPGVLLALFMVEAMLQCTSAIFTRRPQPTAAPVDEDELRTRLLGLSDPGSRFRLDIRENGSVQLDWQPVDINWQRRFSKVKLDTVYRARALLDPVRHELRWYESVRASSFFIGFDGWRPRGNIRFYYQGGMLNLVWSGTAYGIAPGFPPRVTATCRFSIDPNIVKNQLADTLNSSGWGFRPVTMPLYVSPAWLRLTRLIIPDVMHRVAPRRLWGTLYPLSYLATVVYLLTVTGGWSLGNVLIVGLITVMWWGIWGAAVWIISSASQPDDAPNNAAQRSSNRRRRARSKPGRS